MFKITEVTAYTVDMHAPEEHTLRISGKPKYLPVVEVFDRRGLRTATWVAKKWFDSQHVETPMAQPSWWGDHCWAKIDEALEIIKNFDKTFNKE